LPAPIWLDQIERIRDLVNQWGLKPISEHYVDFGGGHAGRIGVPDRDLPVIRWPFPIPFPGGRKFAHLHLSLVHLFHTGNCPGESPTSDPALTKDGPSWSANLLTMIRPGLMSMQCVYRQRRRNISRAPQKWRDRLL